MLWPRRTRMVTDFHRATARRGGYDPAQPAMESRRAAIVRQTVLGCLVFAVVLDPAVARAQIAVEVGIGAGSACAVGTEACHDGVVSPAAIVRVGNAWAIAFQYLVVDQENTEFTFNGLRLTRSNRNRQMALVSVRWYAAQRGSVRPYVGVAFGQRRTRLTAICEPVSCPEAVALGFRAAALTGVQPAQGSTGVTVGVQLLAARRITVEGSVGVHDVFTENQGTVQGQLVIGLSLWRSR